MVYYLKLLRINHWVKNLLLFAPLFFVGSINNVEKLFSLFIAFIAFSLAASCIYILNDYVDIKSDNLHPTKKHRPIASGKVSKKIALMIMLFLFLCSLLLSLQIFHLTYWILVYLLLNVLYSTTLKHIPIIEIMIVSSFYVLRILTGGDIISVYVSPWIILCTIFASLFLITGKRIAESYHNNYRSVLDTYTKKYLHNVLWLSSILSIISYGIYTVLILEQKNQLAIYSIFFVLFGFLRYNLILEKNPERVEKPELLVFIDKQLFINTILWVIYMYIIFY